MNPAGHPRWESFLNPASLSCFLTKKRPVHKVGRALNTLFALKINSVYDHKMAPTS